MRPFFSIIIPLYNKEKYVLKTLDSVLHQSFQDYEIIIMDDGSTDQSESLVHAIKDQRITLIKQSNQGASAARNNAIKITKGHYIALLDADDIWEKHHLKALKNCIEQHPDAVLYCTNYQIKRYGGLITPARFNFIYQSECILIKDFFKANIINFIPTSSSVAFKKEDFLEIKGYNTTLRTAEDIDLWIKFGLLGAIAFNPEITMTYNLFDPLSLSHIEYNLDRYLLIKEYNREEAENASLKLYLDINRYALAIRFKLQNDQKNFDTVVKEINIENLNFKQKLLLKFPRKLLVSLKLLQQFLIKQDLYFTAYK